MKKSFLAAAALLFSVGLMPWALPAQSDFSAELKEMYEQDQAERQPPHRFSLQSRQPRLQVFVMDSDGSNPLV